MDFKIHYEKYQKFKESAQQDRYIPSRIEDYFKSAFHLIEAIVYKKTGVHIQKHQKVRTILKQNQDIFEEKTEELINEFYEIENKIRIATAYGKRENGELLGKTKESFNKIETICLNKLNENARKV